MSGIPADIALIYSTGPTMLGICLNWGFMGILLVQLYYYQEHFRDDRTAVQVLVYGLALLDVLQTVMVTADAFHWFVYGFGNMTQLDETFLNSWDVPVIDAVVSLVVQTFYCWRIYFLCKTRVLPALIVAVSMTQCVAGIYTGVRAHQLGHLSLIRTETVPQTIWLVGGAVADVAIAGVLTWGLVRQRSTTLPSGAVRSTISRIIRLVVETNTLTASVAVIALALFWGLPKHGTLVVPPTAIMGKLYTNSLIALLNNRLRDRQPQTAHGMQSLHLPNSSSQNHSSQHGHGLSDGVKIHVVREMDLTFEPAVLAKMQVSLLQAFIYFSCSGGDVLTPLRSPWHDHRRN
ncbi:hypothetical protein B0H16DRAFT_1775434 [Mycena metata]|uniref:DUF6534 domain-containing protein n=1 Tax=Mycena metata TaxID=1033252 RepID=A0AAD7HWF8_9AGAR|nr:hypothetical protein B0H16DRAFT_1775434 [Mycena metata]